MLSFHLFSTVVFPPRLYFEATLLALPADAIDAIGQIWNRLISNEISVYTPCVLVPKTCPASGSICGQSSMAALLITIQVLWFTQS